MRSFKKPFSAQEEKQYLKMYRNGSEKAGNELIEHNLRLVAHIVKKYNTQGRDLDDLISIGTIGLIKAIHTFDADRGGRLATYAVRCIENELLMMLRQEKKLLREISLYEPIGTDQDGNHVDLLDVLYVKESSMEDQYIYNHYLLHLDELLDELDEYREKEIIIRRYGLKGSRAHTQKEIAGALGISRSYVSRIEKKALEKLKLRYEEI